MNTTHDNFHQSFHTDCKECYKERRATLANKKEVLKKLKANKKFYDKQQSRGKYNKVGRNIYS